ncbi:MAG: LPS-assembly protein LptD [bacterium]
MPIDADNSKTVKNGPQKDIFTFIFNSISVFSKISICLPCVMIFILFFPFTIIAAENTVHLTSERLEYHIPTRKVFVRGDVTLTEEGFRLYADKMELDLASGEGVAQGDIRIFLPQGYRMDTDVAEFNINTGWWRIQAADMQIEPSGLIRFEEAEKTDPNTINMIRPRFTSCPGENPPWEIRGSKGILRLDNSMKIRRLSMRIKGVPVFYLPAAYVPIWRQGSTGMQPPEAGHSSRHGYFLKNLFTWPFTRHTEGRLFLDFFTKTGIGLGAGWKHTPETDSQGSEAKFYLLREDSPEKIHGKADLTADIGGSDQKRGVIDVHYATERDFDRRFSSDLALRDLRIGESRAYVTLQRSVFGIMGEWEHRRSLMDPNNKSDVHLLPRIVSHLQPTPLLKTAKTGYSPLFGLRLSALHMDWDLPEGNPEGSESGESFIIEPGLSLQVPGNHWMTLNTLFSTRQTYYQTAQSEEEDKEGWSHAYMANLILTGPRIYKDYMKTDKGHNENPSTKTETYKGVRHFMYPQVSYEYKRRNGIRPASIMDLEGDTSEMRNIRFLIITRIWGKNLSSAIPDQPAMDLIISQNLYMKNDYMKNDRQAFEIRIDTVPYPLVRFNGRGIFFTERSHGRDIDVDFSLGNSDKGKISMGWRHLRYKINEDSDERTNPYAYNEKLNTARLFITTPPWKGYQFGTSFIYDFEAKDRIIEKKYSVFYKQTCWKARLGYIKHIDEDMVRIDLNLIF